MIDGGDAMAPPEIRKYLIDPKPDGSRRPGEWSARYIQRHLQAAGLPVVIDYIVLTHLHSDHMGRGDDELPKSRFGDFRTSDITDVTETIPVKTVIDRAFPDYNYPAPLDDIHQRNYRRSSLRSGSATPPRNGSR